MQFAILKKYRKVLKKLKIVMIKLLDGPVNRELESINKNETWDVVDYSGIDKNNILDIKWAFSKKAEKGIMIGYVQNGYRLWDINNEKIVVARKVKFDKNDFYFKRNVEIKIVESDNELDLSENYNEQESEENKNDQNTIEIKNGQIDRGEK
ncbi:hypothetical protein JTB14_011435 [Gonioctena quinquepunctata]|nr:hypothetical protein JTB14_011435 [Gonioctena quinquepunctata]